MDLAAKSASILGAVRRYQHKRISQIIVESTPLICQGLQFVLQRKALSVDPTLEESIWIWNFKILELADWWIMSLEDFASILSKLADIYAQKEGAQSLVGQTCFIGYHPADHDEHEAEELGIVTSFFSFVKSCLRRTHSCHQSDLGERSESVRLDRMKPSGPVDESTWLTDI